MYTASAVTNGQGNIIGHADFNQVEVCGETKVPEVIEWSKTKESHLSELTQSNTFSLLAHYILTNHKGAEYHSECSSSSSRKSNYRRVQIDGFEYIERKNVITRRRVKS